MGRLFTHGLRSRAGIVAALLAATLVVPGGAFAGPKSGGDRDKDRDKIDARGGDRGADEGKFEFDDDEFFNAGNLNCPGRHTLVRIDEKTCPATPDRPLLVIKRACCQNPAGKVHCRHFKHCPSKSPS
jgi:hypothetical protein